MKRGPLLVAALSIVSPAGGCIEMAARSGPPAARALPEISSPATWSTPLPLPFPALGRGETDSVLAFVPGTGLVRATPQVLASIGRPLEGQPGENRTVDPCRDAVRVEAEKEGARVVEAASAGPHQQDRQGRYVAPVRMRITYAEGSGYEVREATLTCIVDRSGKIVDASV